MVTMETGGFPHTEQASNSNPFSCDVLDTTITNRFKSFKTAAKPDIPVALVYVFIFLKLFVFIFFQSEWSSAIREENLLESLKSCWENKNK